MKQLADGVFAAPGLSAERHQRLPGGRRAGRRREPPRAAAHPAPARRPRRVGARAHPRPPRPPGREPRGLRGARRPALVRRGRRGRGRASRADPASASPSHPVDAPVRARVRRARATRSPGACARATRSPASRCSRCPVTRPATSRYWRESDRVAGPRRRAQQHEPHDRRPGLHEPPPYFTPDPARNRESARRLAALEPGGRLLRPRPAAPGHAPVRRSSWARCPR